MEYETPYPVAVKISNPAEDASNSAVKLDALDVSFGHPPKKLIKECSPPSIPHPKIKNTTEFAETPKKKIALPLHTTGRNTR